MALQETLGIVPVVVNHAGMGRSVKDLATIAIRQIVDSVHETVVKAYRPFQILEGKYKEIMGFFKY